MPEPSPAAPADAAPASATGITAVVPTRNRPDFVAQIVPSILANTHPSFRVIVVDQSDTDASGEIVRRYAQQDDRLRYIRQEGTGAARSRNLGAAEATDPLIAFVDDDCVVPPDWLARIVAHFERRPEISMLYGQVVAPPNFDPGDGSLPQLYIEHSRVLRPDKPFELFGMSANLAVRRAIFEQVGGFDAQLGVGARLRAGEDFDFHYRAYLAGVLIAIEPDVTVDHYGLRAPDQWPKTMRDYGYGDAAFYLKHVRCGDLRALGWCARRLARVGLRELLLQTGLRKRPSWTHYLAGYLAGIPGSLRVGVDPHSRLYRPC